MINNDNVTNNNQPDVVPLLPRGFSSSADYHCCDVIRIVLYTAMELLFCDLAFIGVDHSSISPLIKDKEGE